ncbi:MAG: hypothetical protein ACSHYF_01945 [Verrucomicrobiaceae bacterium]
MVTSTRDRYTNIDKLKGKRSAGDRLTNGHGGKENDLTSRITQLTQLNDPIARIQGMLSLVENLKPDEFQDLVASFRGLDMTRERMSEYSILLTAWAKIDPLAALDYAKENTGTPFARQTILAAWAQTQPEAAISWAEQNYSGDSKRANPWIVGIINGIVSSDLNRATQLLEGLPYSEGRGEALGIVLRELRQQGTLAAQDWIDDLNDDQLRTGAASRLAESLAQANPEAALTWVASVSEDSLLRSSGTIVEEWARTDPAAARTWVDSQPNDTKAAAARGLMSAIAADDPKGASRWLSQFEGQPEFDRAVQSFVYNVVQKEPELGADWIMKLTNEREQERTFHRILGTMLRDDPQRMMNYIQNNPVPESIAGRAKRQMEEMSAPQR